MVVEHESVHLEAAAAVLLEVAKVVTRLLAVDPGTNVTGWASFADARRVECGGWRADGLYEMLSKLLLVRENEKFASERTAVERPQVYSQRKWRGDPNDLVGVALVAGAVAALFPPVDFVLPHTWKGSAPKDVVAERVRGALSEEELRRLPPKMRHDVWDAVGLGLWSLNRLDKRRAISTA